MRAKPLLICRGPWQDMPNQSRLKRLESKLGNRDFGIQQDRFNFTYVIFYSAIRQNALNFNLCFMTFIQHSRRSNFSETVHRRAINRFNAITNMPANRVRFSSVVHSLTRCNLVHFGLTRRGISRNLSDPRFNRDFRHIATNQPHPDIDKKRQHKVHRRPSDQNKSALKLRFIVIPTLRRNVPIRAFAFLFGQRCVFLPRHFDIATNRQQADAIIGFTPTEPRDTGSHTQTKAIHIDPA